MPPAGVKYAVRWKIGCLQTIDNLFLSMFGFSFPLSFLFFVGFPFSLLRICICLCDRLFVCVVISRAFFH